MTDKDVRLELAKAALKSGSSIESAKLWYTWVCGDAKDSNLDAIKVSELEQYLGMSSVRFRNRCMENDIHTVGQLVRVGSGGFRSMRLVGGGMVDKLRKILSEKYGVEEW